MYKVFVAVSGKRVRIVPSASKPHVAERDFGDLTLEDALANRDHIFEAVRGLLEDRGIEDAELYTIEVPDDLAPRNVNEQKQRDEEVEEGDGKGKGDVTKPKTELPEQVNAEEQPTTKMATDAARKVEGEKPGSEAEKKTA